MPSCASRCQVHSVELTSTSHASVRSRRDDRRRCRKSPLDERFRYGCGVAVFEGNTGEMPAATVDPYIGRTIDGRYLVESLLGEGGMGVVYQARHTVIDKKVAIKVLRTEMASRKEVTDRFLQEAKAASSIGNPHIVDISDFGTLPDGSAYFVMELLGGKSLTDVIADARPMPLARIVTIAKQIASGLREAHDAGIVHRDLKPDNVIVLQRAGSGSNATGEDFIKILDFGIAKVGGEGSRITQAGSIFGTPHYMSPEQASGSAVDHRADIYALGVILYEMASGKVPFDADSFMAILAQHMYRAPAALLSLEPPPKVSAGFDAVVQKCLSKSVDGRYASMERLIADLEKVEAGKAPDALSRSLEPTAPAVEAVPDLAIPDLPISRAAPVAKAAPKPTPQATNKRAPPPAPAASLDSAFDDPVSNIKLDLDMPLGGAISRRPALVATSSSDARASSGVSRASLPRARRRSSLPGRASLAVLLALLATGGALFQFGGPVAMSAVTAAAASRGVLLSATSIELRSGGATLTGAAMTLASVSDLKMTAPEIDVEVDWMGNLRKITIPGYTLSMRGSAKDVAARFAAWRNAPHLPLAFEARAGRLVWADVLSPGVLVEGLDVSMASGSSGEGSLVIDAPSMSVTLPTAPRKRQGDGVPATLGPWRTHLESTTEETKGAVFFDRAKADAPANLTLLTRPALGVLLSASIPRSKAALIGLPVDVLGAGADLEIQLTFEGQEMPTGEPVTARGALSLFGVTNVGGAATATDLVIEGAFGGDTSKPLRIDAGTITLGKVKAHLAGLVTIEPDGARFELERPGAHGPASAPLVLDTREWTQGRATSAKTVTAPAPSASSAPPR